MKICTQHRRPIFDSPRRSIAPHEFGRQGVRTRPGMVMATSHMGSCCQMSSSMGATERDTLAQELAQMQPGEVADLMVATYSQARNRGILMGIGIGVVGLIVVKKVFY